MYKTEIYVLYQFFKMSYSSNFLTTEISIFQKFDHLLSIYFMCILNDGDKIFILHNVFPTAFI